MKREMRVAARTVALFVTGVLAALGVLGAAGCTTDVLHDLDETSANQALSVLEAAGIPATKEPSENFLGGRYLVRVPNRQSVRALGILEAQGLPREPRQGFAELYARPGLIPSPAEERARFVLATVGEIERTLESVDGIISARVHLVPLEPEPNALDGRSRSAARAAVLLKTRAGFLALGPRDVQQLVAGSVPGLEASAVSVIVVPSADTQNAQAVAWTSLGPFVVARTSRPMMIFASGIGLALIGALAVLLLLTIRRRPTTPT
jgi:type III secretion protein J